MQEQQPETQLTWLQERALEDAYCTQSKSLWLAYLLALPLGWLGLHRLYLDRRRSGFLMLAFSLLALLIGAIVVIDKASLLSAMLWDVLAGVLLLVTLLWELVDLILIPFMVRRFNRDLEARLKDKLQSGRPA